MLSKLILFQLKYAKMNSTHNETNTLEMGLPGPWIKVGMAALTITVILTNLIVIILTFAGKCVDKLHMAAYILSLAISDMLFGLVTSPLIIGLWLPDAEWIHSFNMCLAFEILTATFLCESALTLTFISVLHYISVCHPLTFKRFHNKKSASITIVVSWVCSALLMSTSVTTIAHSTEQKFAFCHVRMLIGNKFNYNIFTACSIVVFVLLLFAISFFNIKALTSIKRRTERITSSHILIKTNGKSVSTVTNNGHAEASPQTSTEEQTSRNSSNASQIVRKYSFVQLARTRLFSLVSQSSDQTKTSKRRVPYKAIILLVLSFFVCFAPHFTFSAIEMFNSEYSKLSNVRYIVFMGILLHSCINPFIYASRLPVYKYACAKLFSKNAYILKCRKKMNSLTLAK